MNLNVEPPPPQPSRPSNAACDHHPYEHFTGFCTSCLCERLSVLDTSVSATTSSSSRNKPPIPTTSTAIAALKAIFKQSSSSNFGAGGGCGGSSRSSFFSELRRSKSLSASKNEALGLSRVFEAQRKSCDVRVRNSLLSLFYQENGAGNAYNVVDSRNLASSSTVRNPVKEETEEEIETEIESISDSVDEIRDSEDLNLASNANTQSSPMNPVNRTVSEIVEEEDTKENQVPEMKIVHEVEEIKSMKDHIDLDAQAKKPANRDFKEIAGSFWSAASVFSKKWQKWRQKQKLKKLKNGGSSKISGDKPMEVRFRETQSEIADYGFGRRSIDTDPRFSLDAGRISFEDPRYSLDVPRASWDGHLIGRNLATSIRIPRIASVKIPVDDHTVSYETIPGGSMQTREYYDSSTRRRKSIDRSNSTRKTATEIDGMSSASNTKVTDSNINSLSDTLDIGSIDNVDSVVASNGEKTRPKKSRRRRWVKGWGIWGFIHRRNANKENDNTSSKVSRLERSLSESWQEREQNPKVLRSSSSVSWRNTGLEDTNENGKKRTQSSNNTDKGILRLYLAPMRGIVKKSRENHSHSIMRSLLRLY